jgi:Major capsid protein Gp23
MTKELNSLVESRLAAIQSERSRLTKSWSPYISSVKGYMQKQGKVLTENDERNIARCLENALLESGVRSKSSIFEATDSSAISFLGIQLPVISALLPSLVLNKLAVTQALDRRSGAVFYMNVKYGTTKGSITTGDTMISALTGQNASQAGRQFASVRVNAETFSGASATLVYTPVVLGTVVIVSADGLETLTDYVTPGVLIPSSSTYGEVTAGTVTAAGVVTLNGAGTGVWTVTYQYNWQTFDGVTADTESVPQVDIEVTSSTITAEDFPLRAYFTLGAAIDLEKSHGLNLEDELVKYLGGEVKFTMDHLGIDLMNKAAHNTLPGQIADAATTPGTYTATPTTGETWVWKKYEFIDFVEKANVSIINQTLRAICNFIVVGSNSARLIRQLEPHFKPAAGLDSLVPTGPYELGTLDGRLIIHDPLLGVNEILFGFKGDNYLFAGLLFAPYIPLFATPTLVTADLKAQKGFLSSAGYKVINSGMFCYGTMNYGSL